MLSHLDTILACTWAIASVVTYICLDMQASMYACVFTAIGLPPVLTAFVGLMLAGGWQQYQSMFNFVNGTASLFDVLIVCLMFSD